MALSDELQARVVGGGVVPRLQRLLAATADSEERTLQLNALACLSEALRDQESEVDALIAAGGTTSISPYCAP